MCAINNQHLCLYTNNLLSCTWLVQYMPVTCARCCKPRLVIRVDIAILGFYCKYMLQMHCTTYVHACTHHKHTHNTTLENCAFHFIILHPLLNDTVLWVEKITMLWMQLSNRDSDMWLFLSLYSACTSWTTTYPSLRTCRNELNGPILFICTWIVVSGLYHTGSGIKLFRIIY